MGIKRDGERNTFFSLHLIAAYRRSISRHYLQKLYHYLISVMLTDKMVSEKP